MNNHFTVLNGFRSNVERSTDVVPAQETVLTQFCFFADRHSSSSEEEKKEHEKKFKEIGEAYGVLSDAKKRSRYDSGCDIDDLVIF